MDFYLIGLCLVILVCSAYGHDKVQHRLTNYLLDNPHWPTINALMQALKNDTAIDSMTHEEQRWLFKMAMYDNLTKWLMILSIIGFAILVLKHPF